HCCLEVLFLFGYGHRNNHADPAVVEGMTTDHDFYLVIITCVKSWIFNFWLLYMKLKPSFWRIFLCFLYCHVSRWDPQIGG
ncbi:unnamed protein product, partial [Citrullus colocynthis]